MDYWAAVYQAKRAKGENLEEFEDDPELSLENVLAALEEGTWEELQEGFEYPDQDPA